MIKNGFDEQLILVYTTSLAIRIQKLCMKSGFEVKLIPTPRHLSSDCGMCVKFKSQDKVAIIQLLESHRINYNDIVPL